ncbi:hypothetical protein [Streptomyces sp. NBC_00094]|uniref:hypothetical protein n=1 Tax=Streptomyces sp. NBC_00094 TaxID=2903620 RepID=UPI00225BD6FD|nr:hypothetical protein [Streptomyces sp. NBC_00094]MCX5391227.1 hypothetical protein [Streptomyces sp. NBC_00094]
MTPHPPAEDRHATTETRLRAALTARAALVTHQDLRRENPPQGRARTARALYGPGLAALAAAAAVAAVCVLYLLPGGLLAPAPVQPARPPGITDPAPPTTAPTTPSPAAEPRVLRPSD